jgi:hypothetical protein
LGGIPCLASMASVQFSLAVVWIGNVQFNWGFYILTAPKKINNRLCMGR